MKRFFPLLLGLICITYTTSFCHVPIKICDFKHLPLTNQSSCNPTAAELTNIGNCIGTVKAHLRVANLAQNPVLGNSYSLPLGAPDMYYEYTIDGVTNVIGPINTFVYVSNHKGATGQSHPIYEFSHDMNFSLEGYCKAPLATNIFFDVRIIDDSGDLYDLDNHGNSNQIFTCKVFEETCNYCDPTCPGTQLDYPNLLACGEPCHGCPASNKLVANNQGIDNISQISDDKYSLINEIVENDLLDVNISPNPFNDRLEVSFPFSLSSDITLQIIDSEGKTVTRKNFQPRTEKSVSMDLSSLNKGVYYCRIINGAKTIVKKIVKI